MYMLLMRGNQFQNICPVFAWLGSAPLKLFKYIKNMCTAHWLKKEIRNLGSSFNKPKNVHNTHTQKDTGCPVLRTGDGGLKSFIYICMYLYYEVLEFIV